MSGTRSQSPGTIWSMVLAILTPLSDQNMGIPREWQDPFSMQKKSMTIEAAITVSVVVMAAPVTVVKQTSAVGMNTEMRGGDIEGLVTMILKNP